MLNQDPIKTMESIVHTTHNETSKYTRPVLKRYPLVFSFLSVFSVAALLYGFELTASKIVFFQNHPFSLIVIGIAGLFFTGSLFKFLDKGKNSK